MVAVVRHSERLDRPLNYNETKVSEGVARCLAAEGYPKDLDELNFHQKLAMLANRAALNTTTAINSVHISLNFHPSEKYGEEKLRDIAREYMEQLGFGDQPYLLYEHYDAGHPHVHILTTNIRSDGKAINLNNIGRVRSGQARMKVEEKFDLVRAEGRGKGELWNMGALDVSKIAYGRKPLKRAMQSILQTVIENYKFSSLPELNALLRQYNIAADRGEPGSRIYRNRGLVYRALDEHGVPVGIPIKASDFYLDATLGKLEDSFPARKRKKQFHKATTRSAIDRAISSAQTLHNGTKRTSLGSLVDSLRVQGITTVLRQNKQGMVYGITFIDHNNKCVFNGRELGEDFGAKAILQRSGIQLREHPLNENAMNTKPDSQRQEAISPDQIFSFFLEGISVLDRWADAGDGGSMLEVLTQAEEVPDLLPYLLKKRRKKKKRKNR